MVSKRITRSKKELLEYLKKEVDSGWDNLTAWEKSFIEDILSNYDRYGDNTFLSDNQVNILIAISEKIL